MKKAAVITLMALTINMFSPVLPQVHAAFLEDKLAEVVTADPNMVRVQELLRVKKDLEQGKKEALWDLLAKTALEKASQSKEAGAVIASAANRNLNKDVETALRQEVEQTLGARLASYEKELAVISMLFNLNNVLVPQSVRTNNSLMGAPQNYKRVLDMTATAYAPGPLDNGKWGDKTYMGGKVRKGVAAVDPNVIPMGTRLWVEGYGEAIAEDQGSAIKGNRIDLAFNTRSEALDYGIKKVKVYVLE